MVEMFAANTIGRSITDSDASIFRIKILWIFCFVLISVKEEALLSAISIGIGLVPFTPMISIGVINKWLKRKKNTPVAEERKEYTPEELKKLVDNMAPIAHLTKRAIEQKWTRIQLANEIAYRVKTEEQWQVIAASIIAVTIAR